MNVVFAWPSSILVYWEALIWRLQSVCIPWCVKPRLISIAGAVIEYGDYQITLNSMGGAFALTLLMVIFWMPETAYTRSDALSIDTGHDLVCLHPA